MGPPSARLSRAAAREPWRLLLRDNYWRIGAGLTCSLSRLDLFASYVEYVGGSDTHDGRALTVGLSVPFGR